MLRALGVMLVVLLFSFPLRICASPTKQTTTVFQQGGMPVRIEWSEPVGTGDHPVVILLHGQGGISDDAEDFFRSSAAKFCEAGYTAAVLHYFDREGITSASSAQMGKHFSDWLNTISDAISYAKKKTGQTKIALFGHSLGAQLALIQASRDKRVSCVIELSGSLVFPLRKGDKLPPVLILHGDADRVVPIQKERQLESVLKAQATAYEKHIYPGLGHAFSPDSQSDLLDRSIAFLRKKI